MSTAINSVIEFLGTIGPYFLIGVLFFLSFVTLWNDHREKKSKKNT